MAEGISQRQACRVLGFCRARLSYREDSRKILLRERIRALAMKHPRFGYRRIHALLGREQSCRENFPNAFGLGREGAVPDIKTVHRLWKQEKLAVKPSKRKRKRRGKGFPYPPKACFPNHVWTYDFMQDSLVNGKKVRLLNVVDEFTRECHAIEVKRSMGAKDVLDCLTRTMAAAGMPWFIRSDNGSEFIEAGLREWLASQGTKPLYVQPGSPWQNGKCESFNGKFRDEFLNRELFYSLKQIQVQAEWWRNYYNTERPHSVLGYQTPTEYRQAWEAQTRSKALRAPNKGDLTGYLQ